MLFDESTIRFLKETIANNGWLELPSSGESMYPFIHQGDLCRFEVCRPSEIQKGDIILFSSQEGQLIAHRFIGIKLINGHSNFIFKGDTNLGYDHPVTKERILGKLTYVKKKHAQLSSNTILPNVWGKIVLLTPIVPYILRRYLNLKLKYNRKMECPK